MKNGEVWAAGDGGLLLRMRPAEAGVAVTRIKLPDAKASEPVDWIAGEELPIVGTASALFVPGEGNAYRAVPCQGRCGRLQVSDGSGRIWLAGKRGPASQEDIHELGLFDPTAPSVVSSGPDLGPPFFDTVALARQGDEVWGLVTHLGSASEDAFRVSKAGGPYVSRRGPPGAIWRDLWLDPQGDAGLLLGIQGNDTVLWDKRPDGSFIERAKVPGLQRAVLGFEGGRVAFVVGNGVFRVEGKTVERLGPASEAHASADPYTSSALDFAYPAQAALEGASADDVWIVGAGGVVLHWNGKTLDTVFGARAGSKLLMQGLAFVGDDRWIALTAEGVLVEGQIGSTELQLGRVPGSNHPTLVGLRSGEVVLHAIGGLWLRGEAGSWKPLDAPPISSYRLAGKSSSDLWAYEPPGFGEPNAQVAHFDGTSWRELEVKRTQPSYVKDVAVSEEGDLWLLEYPTYDLLRYRRDGTGERLALPLAKGDDLEAMAITRGQVWFAGGGPEGALLARWDGAKLERWSALGDKTFTAIDASKGQVWAVGPLGDGAHVNLDTKAAPESVAIGLPLSSVHVAPSGAVIGTGANVLIVERRAPH